jgi:lysylphosphatidylglycerol synthetase-like protein (DUF2156 family)
MGCDAWIDLDSFHLSGNHRRSLRNTIRKAEQSEIAVSEISIDRSVAAQLETVSSKWVSSRRMSNRQYRFLSRPVEFQDEPYVRKFVARQYSEILAFVCFDPIWQAGRITGYAASNTRGIRMQGMSVQDLILLKAIELFQNEGLSAVSLGLMPFYNLLDHGELNPSPLVRWFFEQVYRHDGVLLNSQGLAFHKNRYLSRKEPVYFASKSSLPFLQLHSISRLCGLRPVRQAARTVLRTALGT